jgi:hypothetical protein
MRQVHFSPRALTGFIFFVLAFALVFSIDKGSGSVSRAWPVLILALLIGSTFAIYRRMWRARGNPDHFKKAEAQGLYGVLPEKLRNWLFP